MMNKQFQEVGLENQMNLHLYIFDALCHHYKIRHLLCSLIQILVNNNFSSFYIQKYEELGGDIIYKKFLDNLFLFALFRGKLDEKNLKSVIIELFGDFKENQKNLDFKRLGYLACYVLNSTRKDSNNTMNKSNNDSLMFYGDYSIVSSIGERFKEDEKSLTKKTPNRSNFK